MLTYIGQASHVIVNPDDISTIYVSALPFHAPATCSGPLDKGATRMLRDPARASGPPAGLFAALPCAQWSTVPNSVFYPMLVLATLATVVASQAIISACFSICKQVRPRRGAAG